MTENNPWETPKPEDLQPTGFETPATPAGFETPAAPAGFEPQAAPVAPEYGQPAAPAGFETPAAPAGYETPAAPAGFETSAAPAQPVQPAYGQVADPYAAPAQPAYAAAPAQPVPGQPVAGQPVQPAYAPAPGQPVPGQPLPGQYPGAAAPALPGRGGAIAMLVSGLVMMLIIAPIVLFAGVAGSVVNNLDSLTSSTVVLDQQDSVVINVTGPSQREAVCGLVSESGEVYEAHPASNGQQVDKVPAGTYTVACDNITESDIVVAMSQAQALSMFAGGVGLSFLASFIIGTIGLVLLIVGIVKLVKVNKKRAAMANPYGW